MACNLYDVLLVKSDATPNEIKLAFKKRALQVHPDKGGSKEEFHSVYQALETLVDPRARKRYDASLLSPQFPSLKRKKQKAPGASKQRPAAAQTKAPPKASNASKEKPRPPGPSGSSFKASGGRMPPSASQSKEAKLLMKIRDLLQQLPRDQRQEVLKSKFSQQQRKCLERWMVSQTEQPSVTTVATAAENSSSPKNSAVQSCLASQQHTALPDGSSNTLALQTVCNLEIPHTRKICGKNRITNKPLPNKKVKRVRRMCGTITKEKGWKSDDCYRTRLRFDGMDICTGKTDLPTALELLMLLTAVKQKVRDPSNTGTFEQRFQEAMTSSAQEHERNVADLNLRFSILQSAAFFIGPGHLVRTPKVRSIETLVRIRQCFDCFPQYGKHIGRQSVFWRCSPGDLEDAWERFQHAVASAWKMAGENCEEYMQKLHSLHEASAGFRRRHLRIWEQYHMAMQDKSKHRPKRLQDTSTRSLEVRERKRMAAEDNKPRGDKDEERHSLHPQPWERKQMALQDKNRHRPRKLRVAVNGREKHVSRILFRLMKQLARWENMLRRQAEAADKERCKLLRQRELKKKRDREEHRRSAELKRKKQREEERQRRESLAKRMKADLTMDDILGHRNPSPEKDG
eukprot:Skav232598  [mRNA]  locus=scaffold2040:142134:144020:- [translate_table: standard]